MTAELARTLDAYRPAVAALPGTRGVVLTMGALHEGHAALIRAARDHVGPHGHVAVTVFVNPLQFGPDEDYDRYPRTLDADLALAGKAGADVVFAPDTAEVYPGGGVLTTVCAGPMGAAYEGAHRPGHFDGMLTVVAKLLHLTGADVTFFGAKDAQQVALVRRMTADLNFPVDVVTVPTVRDTDGMAMSSRNRYLSDEERVSARQLSHALFTGERERTRGPGAVLRAARAVLDEAAGARPPVVVDYLALIDPATFTDAPRDHTGPAVLAVAARVGATRLIDNLPLVFGDAG